jgi:hypothetical protein
MNSKPRRSSFGPRDEAALLDAMGAARTQVTRLCGAISPNCDRYRRCAKVLEAIDDLAADMTGDKTFFHSKPHGMAW